MTKEQRIIIGIANWLRNNVSGDLGLLVPVSGGSDSALCFWLCNQVFPNKTVGVYAGADLRERKWFESVGRVRFIEPPSFSSNAEIFRWAKFLEICYQERRVLIGTRNRMEDLLGGYSLASRLATVLPLAGVWKSDVLKCCEALGVPPAITDSSRKADPDCGRPQEMAEIPMGVIERFLKVKSGLKKPSHLRGVSKAQRDYLEKMYSQNVYKLDLPEKGPVIE
ncbi:MAG: hypothetical protein G01um101419_496 [Parcubacteria group bacterium Gr01-1014_19]|nr:MAG: hypothetical protein G01um101419_496 [Parcubacteria group bacterium Gr01-1014_19]